MALIKCPQCGEEISDKAKKCIHCNYVLRNKENKKTKHKKRIWAIIIFVIAFFLILIILCKSVFLKVNILHNVLEAGERTTISKVIEPVYSFTNLENADSIVNTQTIGETSIPYTLRCFGLSTNKNLEIEVVDTKSPVINGPDSLVVTNGSNINWSDKYTVDDFTPNLAEKITLDGKIPSKEGIYDLTLSVKDSSGNIGTKQISVEVLKATNNEKAIVQFINKKGYDLKDITKIRFFTSDNQTYFIEVNGSDIYYYNTEDNDLYTFEESALIAGRYNQISSYKLMLEMLFKDIDMNRIQKLIQ